MRAVFHLLTIFVKVVDPEAIKIWRTRLWNLLIDSSSTRKKHCAVRSFVTCVKEDLKKENYRKWKKPKKNHIIKDGKNEFVNAKRVNLEFKFCLIVQIYMKSK